MESPTEPELHPLLRNRWSPRVWDLSHEATESQIASLLEAARWAPSAGNSQPWAFVVGRRGDEVHQRIVPHLAASSRAWAPDASLLVVNLSHRFVEDTEWEYSEFSSYDLGQAVAHMTLQALAMGLSARQFRGFDRDALSAELVVPLHWQLMTITAFGVVGKSAGGASPQATRSKHPSLRERRGISEIVWPLPPTRD